MVTGIRYRQAGVKDIPLLAAHHRQMFEEMRSLSGISLQSICCGPECSEPVQAEENAPLTDFRQLEQAQKCKLEQQLPDGSCVAWIAENQGRPVGSGAVSILKTTPVPEDPSIEIGFLHSIYILPAMRRRGIASTLIEHLLEDCRKTGIRRVQLNASEAGQRLYTEKGFKPLSQVMIRWL